MLAPRSFYCVPCHAKRWPGDCQHPLAIVAPSFSVRKRADSDEQKLTSALPPRPGGVGFWCYKSGTMVWAGDLR